MVDSASGGVGNRLNAGGLMNASIVTLRRNSKLSEIYAVMNQYQQVDFPVIDENSKLVGMLYEENIRKALKDCFYSPDGHVFTFAESARQAIHSLKIRADEMMTPDTGWVSTETEIGKIVTVMEGRNVRCLPVFGEGRVLGMISTQAILMELLRQGLELKNVLGSSTTGESSSGTLTAEKRRHPRKTVSFKLAYKAVSFDVDLTPTDSLGNPTAQKASIAKSLNLSLGGMLVHASEQLSPDDVVELVFEVPSENLPIRRLARVTRAVPLDAGGCHFGLMFLALSVQETAMISKYLKSLPE